MKGSDALTAKETPPPWRLRGRDERSGTQRATRADRGHPRDRPAAGPRRALARRRAARRAARGRDGDAQKLYQPVAVEVRERLERHPDVLVRGDRGRRLRDRTTLPMEA